MMLAHRGRMLNRLAPGVLVGLIFGVCGASGLVVELGASTVGASAAYLLAAATGVAMGLVAGKPCWVRNAGLESALKALFGAIAATVYIFLLRRWVHADVDLRLLNAGRGSLGELPAAFVPLFAVALACFYELDDTSDLGSSPPAGVRVRLAIETTTEAAPPITAPAEMTLEDTDVEESRAKTTKRA